MCLELIQHTTMWQDHWLATNVHRLTTQVMRYVLAGLKSLTSYLAEART